MRFLSTNTTGPGRRRADVWSAARAREGGGAGGGGGKGRGRGGGRQKSIIKKYIVPLERINEDVRAEAEMAPTDGGEPVMQQGTAAASFDDDSSGK